MSRCPQCSAELFTDDRFCGRCGHATQRLARPRAVSAPVPGEQAGTGPAHATGSSGRRIVVISACGFLIGLIAIFLRPYASRITELFSAHAAHAISSPASAPVQAPYVLVPPLQSADNIRTHAPKPRHVFGGTLPAAHANDSEKPSRARAAERKPAVNFVLSPVPSQQFSPSISPQASTTISSAVTSSGNSVPDAIPLSQRPTFTFTPVNPQGNSLAPKASIQLHAAEQPETSDPEKERLHQENRAQIQKLEVQIQELTRLRNNAATQAQQAEQNAQQQAKNADSSKGAAKILGGTSAILAEATAIKAQQTLRSLDDQIQRLKQQVDLLKIQ